MHPTRCCLRPVEEYNGNMKFSCLATARQTRGSINRSASFRIFAEITEANREDHKLHTDKCSYLGYEALHRQGCSDFRYCKLRHILHRVEHVASGLWTKVTTIIGGFLIVNCFTGADFKHLPVARRIRLCKCCRKGCQIFLLMAAAIKQLQ